MITDLDHVAIAVRGFEAAVDGYRRLLGREPDFEPRDGANRAWFRLPNMALEVIAPDGEGGAGDRLRARLKDAGEGLWLAAFRVGELGAAVKLAGRRGLDVDMIGPVARIRAAGLVFVLTTDPRMPLSAAICDEAAAVASLDHVVVQTPNPDRALALYGAKFGLDLRLDRENAQWGARQLFFRCGDAVFEIGASLKTPVSDGPDRFGGLAWRVTDPDAVHARLAAAGFNVSELRTGRKPGTKVFTVRDAPGGIPTLVIQQNAGAA